MDHINALLVTKKSFIHIIIYRYHGSSQTGEQREPETDLGLHADAHGGVQGDQHG